MQNQVCKIFYQYFYRKLPYSLIVFRFLSDMAGAWGGETHQVLNHYITLDHQGTF